MTTHLEFDLAFALPEGEHDPMELSDAVYEAGFSDAVPGTGQRGVLAVGCIEADGEDAEAAILQAAAAILKHLPVGSRLHEVHPDRVSLAEVSHKLGVERQALAQRRLALPVAGRLFRVTDINAALDEIVAASARKPRLTIEAARPWLRAGEAATRINAKIALGELQMSND
jgi:hypothetical protein